jgi:hypothetical protein
VTNPPHAPAHPGTHGEPTVWTGLAQPRQGPPDQPPSSGRRLGFRRDRLPIVLVIVVVLVLGVTAVLGGELYVRYRANAVMTKVFECEVRDGASVSFGTRPLLLQAMTGTYSDISIETAGNQIRQAKGMKVDLQIDDLRLQNTGNSRGTLGSLDADITWSNAGIKQSLQDAIPIFGGMVTGVTTNPSDDTIELQAGFGSMTLRPQVADGGLALKIVKLTGLILTPPREAMQPVLDAFTSSLTKNLPMGIHADSVQVTETGVTSRFSTRDATIPLGGQDPCLTGL